MQIQPVGQTRSHQVRNHAHSHIRAVVIQPALDLSANLLQLLGGNIGNQVLQRLQGLLDLPDMLLKPQCPGTQIIAPSDDDAGSFTRKIPAGVPGIRKGLDANAQAQQLIRICRGRRLRHHTILERVKIRIGIDEAATATIKTVDFR